MMFNDTIGMVCSNITIIHQLFALYISIIYISIMRIIVMLTANFMLNHLKHNTVIPSVITSYMLQAFMWILPNQKFYVVCKPID